ncbi:MAG TPA: DUF4835 family protein [Candidatus Kapabacteria bacterium]|nr:DUF4835 family protein [Candidatus Kapabacteria bacterium]
MKRFYFLFIGLPVLFIGLSFLFMRPLRAQELDAQVDLNVSSLSVTDQLNFFTFKHDLEGYLNNFDWTTDFTGERIRCSFEFNIVSNNGGDYTAQLFVNSTRPLYKSTQMTTMARFFDATVEFPYYRSQEFAHGTNYRPLESLIDFYVYIILGLDYDSYKLEAGTPYFQQAQTIAVVANSAQGTGWQQDVTAIGTYTRMGYINDALDANIRAYRDLIFMYHYDGLDLLSTKPDDARQAIGTVLDSLVTLKRETSAAGRSVFLRAFFEAKYPELTDLSRLFPDNLAIYFQKLGFLDPVHQTYYQDALTKDTQPASGGE